MENQLPRLGYRGRHVAYERIYPMTQKDGWYVVEVKLGPLSDAELVDLAKAQKIDLETTVYHPAKTKAQIVKAKRIKTLAKTIAASRIDDAGAIVTQRSKPAPIEFKGFTLGEYTLETFVKQFHHFCDGHPEPGPQLSSNMHPEAVGSIWAEEWHAANGVVSGRIAFPFERYYDGEYWFTVAGEVWTIASVKMYDMVHQFIDGILCRMTIDVPSAGFAKIIDAFSHKYGSPSDVETEIYQNAYGASFDGNVINWKFPDCSIIAVQYAGDRDTSRIVFFHDTLFSKIDSRKPAPSIADL